MPLLRNLAVLVRYLKINTTLFGISLGNILVDPVEKVYVIQTISVRSKIVHYESELYRMEKSSVQSYSTV